ncbi:MAG: hypothetical protein KF724_05700 [Phycisphaeraceae bacterium]|nr:hypothetical protein [Phycisphaeraceae bacterium]
MPSLCLHRLVTSCVLACSLASPLSASAPPWSGAELLPSDVDLFVHVDNASRLRGELSSLPLADAVHASIIDDEVRARWAAIARRMGRSGEQCFDDLFGNDMMMALRRMPGGAPSDWILATRVDPRTLERVVERLRPRLCGRGVMEFPCQGVAAWWSEPMLYIAPSQSSPLFAEVMARAQPQTVLARQDGARRRTSGIGASQASIAAPAESTPGASSSSPLVDLPIIQSAIGWPSSRVQIYSRHRGWLGGEAVLTLELRDEQAIVRARGSFDHLPAFGAPFDETPLDTTLLARFESMATATLVRPLCAGAMSPLMQQVLPESMPCEGMRRNAGDRMVIVLGDVDGGPGLDCKVPAFAVAFEVREPCEGRRLHEAMIRKAVEGFNTRYAKTLGGEITPPMVAACADIEDPRQCDLSRQVRLLTGDHPLFRTVSLHWRAVAGDTCNWQLYATHREWLDRVAQRLERAELAHPELSGGASAPPSGFPAGTQGFLRGGRASTMVQSWDGVAASFVEGDATRFREALRLLSSMLRGVEQVRWRLEREDDRTMEAECWIDFAAVRTP